MCALSRLCSKKCLSLVVCITEDFPGFFKVPAVKAAVFPMTACSKQVVTLQV